MMRAAQPPERCPRSRRCRRNGCRTSCEGGQDPLPRARPISLELVELTGEGGAARRRPSSFGRQCEPMVAEARRPCFFCEKAEPFERSYDRTTMSGNQSGTSPGCSAPMPAIRRPRPLTSFTGGTSPRVRPGFRSPSICRPRPATIPTTSSPAARWARSACRSPISATCGACSRASRSAEMNTSMTINATAAWLLALYIALAEEQGAATPSSPARCRTTS